MKNLKDMEFQELVTMQTGESVMALGAGQPLNSIIREAMRTAIQWDAQRVKANPGGRSGNPKEV